MLRLLAFVGSILLLTMQMALARGILVEAEGFKDLGGWVVDQQFMDQMGSPYLLAHGMGVPVANASTEVNVAEGGSYRMWVRTKDWAPPHHPGRFQVILNGKAADREFGTEGKDWLWQDGGTVQVAAGKLRIELKDLTGFEGRCDAIYLASDANDTPPGKPDLAMRAWRKGLLGLPKEAPDAGNFDLVVIGGGTAGSCSAAAAAQMGLKVALIQDRPVLGGVSSPEVGIAIEGLKANAQFPGLFDLTQKNVAAMRKAFAGQENLTLFAWTHAFAVEKEGARVKAVIAQHCLTSAELRFRAPLFVDCTGDATIGFLAGAEYRYGREGKDETGEKRAPAKSDEMHMGLSILWRSRREKTPQQFPDCPWALRITAENVAAVTGPKGAASGGWDWEAGFFDRLPENDEVARDRLFRGIYGLWDYQKNRSADKATWANHRLDRVTYVAGKRESRRLVGDVVLTEQDVTKPTEFPDGCVTLGWGIDLHDPSSAQSKLFPGEEFRSVYKAGHPSGKALIPFRCFYSKNVANLMMAGRCMSTTHVAMGTTRVMGTGAQVGSVTGVAAALCKKHGCTPRELYEKHLAELLEALKAGK